MKKPLTTLPSLPRHLAQLLLVLCLLPATSCQQIKLGMHHGSGDRPDTPTTKLSTAVVVTVPGIECRSAVNATLSPANAQAGKADVQVQAGQPKTHKGKKGKKKKPLTEEERKKKNAKKKKREKRNKQRRKKVQELQTAMCSYCCSLEDFSEKIDASKNKRLFEYVTSFAQTTSLLTSKLAEGKVSDVLNHFLKEEYELLSSRYQKAEEYFSKIIGDNPKVFVPEDKALQALMTPVSTEQLSNRYEFVYMGYSFSKNITDMIFDEEIVGGDLSADTQELLEKLKPIRELLERNSDVPFFDRCTYFTVLKRLLVPSIKRYGSPETWSGEAMKKVLKALLPKGPMTDYILSINAQEGPAKFKSKFIKILLTAFRAKGGKKSAQAQFDRYAKELVDAFGFSNKAKDEALVNQLGEARLDEACGQLFAPTQSPKKPGCSDATQPKPKDPLPSRRSSSSKAVKERKRTTSSNKAVTALPPLKIKPVSHLDSPKPLIEEERKRVAHKQKTRKRGTIPSPSNEACVEAPTNKRSSYIAFLSEKFKLPKSLRMGGNKFFHGATLPTEAPQLSKKHQQVVDDLYNNHRKVTVTCSQVEALWKAVGGKVKTSGGGSHHKIISFEGETLSPLWAVHGTSTLSYGPRFCKMLSAALLKRGILPTCLKEAWEQQQ